MHDHPAGQMVRPSKTRAMFAMRACRKSVMVGMPLTKRQMTTVCSILTSIHVQTHSTVLNILRNRLSSPWARWTYHGTVLTGAQQCAICQIYLLCRNIQRLLASVLLTGRGWNGCEASVMPLLLSYHLSSIIYIYTAYPMPHR